MAPLQRVVIGLDGSALSVAAAAWAAARVPEGGAVHLVHGIRPAAELVAAAFQSDGEAIRRAAEADLEGPWAEPARAAGRPVVTHIVEDEPAHAVLRVAAAVDATAIVVGMHGAGAGHLPLLGAVARRILHRSNLPMVVAHPDGPGPVVPPSGPPLVVAGVGYGDASDLAVLWAADYAAARGLPLELVHAVPFQPMFPADSPSDTLASYLGPGVEAAWAREDLELVREQVLDRHADLTVTVRVASGSVVDALAAPVGSLVELVVAGKRHGARLARMTISPRLRQLIVGAAAPVAVIPSTSPVPAV
ncbi:MAG: universal stress protein [Acidimicrobiia bacterium]|nr:universal stress protein [Acidimicrobiia bacterium]MDH5288738.1 universal stress protein [Acidimicrobiia bacterium]